MPACFNHEILECSYLNQGLYGTFLLNLDPFDVVIVQELLTLGLEIELILKLLLYAFHLKNNIRIQH